ncbi:EDD domain protein, DegV family [Cupriavidus sp. OV038]|jgi:DegV family protein with EDD domain|uniref:DegV family protein n=1 Tax=unclassified Cupriavidus TaxID=2640874 RepID=UPI0008DF4264|nr:MULTISPECIES: DegV family protein [unclassified Cupriavidus]SFC83595.1 EDD domain protein, DegV family [Cupriavidus sp. OV038]SFO79618.1 EDD domain protein, DegV family [Cupriavidus sp. OV096]
MQETAILADAACDMPRAMMDALGVHTIPFRIRAGDRFVVDTRDEAALPDLYQQYLVGKQDHYAESIPLLERELEDHLLKHVVAGCDRAILLTIASTRSKFYANATGAVVGTVARSFKLRKDAGRSGLFDLTVIDTGAIGPGQALIVREVARMLGHGGDAAAISHAVETRLRDAAHMIMVPNELLYMYTRAKQKGENSITWGRYMLGNAFNIRPIIRMHQGETEAIAKARGQEDGIRRLLAHAESCVRAGCLLTPDISVAYAGNIDEVRAWPAWQSLAATAERAGVELMLAPMSLTVALNIGAGAFSIGYLSEVPPPFV